MDKAKSDRRPYKMSARAEAMADVDRRVLEAADALIGERWLEEITLQAVAGRAGVTVPTVLRRYGTRDELLEAAGKARNERVVDQRDEVATGDIDSAVRIVLDHYEEMGDSVIRFLAQEPREPMLQPYMQAGRELHEAWVRRVFAPYLGGRSEHLVAQLVVATDVYSWKLWRRDRGFSRDETEQCVRSMIDALLGGTK